MAEREATAIYAVRPWQSVDSMGTWRYRGADDQSKIDKCLACTRADCTNCLAGTGRRVGRPGKTSPEIVAAYIATGMTRQEICNALGIALSTYNRYKAAIAG